jgi:hypothetical protein
MFECFCTSKVGLGKISISNVIDPDEKFKLVYRLFLKRMGLSQIHSGCAIFFSQNVW